MNDIIIEEELDNFMEWYIDWDYDDAREVLRRVANEFYQRGCDDGYEDGKTSVWDSIDKPFDRAEEDMREQNGI